MINPEYYLAFLFTAAALAAAPGPNLLYIVSQSLRLGHWLSIPSAAGMIAASFIYAILAVGGASAFLNAYPSLLVAAKLIGACYLLWLAYRQFCMEGVESEINQDRTGSGSQRFLSGFLVGISNPKTMIFYLTFIPQFVDPHLPVQPQLILLNVSQLVVLSGITLGYAVAAAPIRKTLNNPKRIEILNKLAAGILALASLVMVASLLPRSAYLSFL